MEDNKRTSAGEWVLLSVIIVISIAIAVVIFAVLRPRLFSGEEQVGDALEGKGCVPTAAPENVTISIPEPGIPSINVTWDPRTTTTVPGETILGYRAYLSTSTVPTGGIYTPVRSIRFTNLVPDTTYFVRVATVDTCGEGPVGATPVTVYIPPT